VSPRLRTLLAAVAFAAISALVAARTIANLNVPGQPAVERFGLQDFRDNFYYPSVALLDGRNPYDYDDYRVHYPIDRPLPPYSPISLLLNVPLALLPYGPAMAADFVLNLALLVLLAALAVRGAGVPAEPWRVLLVAAALVLGRPGHMTLYIGQCSALMAVGCTTRPPRRTAPAVAGGDRSRRRLRQALLRRPARRPDALPRRRAGLSPGRGARRRPRGRLGIGADAGRGGLGPLLESVRGSMRVVATDSTFNEPTSLIRLDPVSLVGRLLGRPPGTLVNVVLAVVILGAAALLMRRLASRGEPEPRPISNSLGCLAILLGTYHQPYDALILALPVTALLLMPGPFTARRAVLAILMLVPAANYLATFTLLERFDVPWFAWLVISESNGVALALALILGMGLAWERARRGFST
jgi:hypothetical protein